jgi:hypothetical protein
VTVCKLEAGDHETESQLVENANAHVQVLINQVPSDLSEMEQRTTENFAQKYANAF